MTPIQDGEVLALHHKLAAETLRADQGWERAEAKSKECNELREQLASLKATPYPKPWSERMGVEVGQEVHPAQAFPYMKAELLEWRASVKGNGTLNSQQIPEVKK